MRLSRNASSGLLHNFCWHNLYHTGEVFLSCHEHSKTQEICKTEEIQFFDQKLELSNLREKNLDIFL